MASGSGVEQVSEPSLTGLEPPRGVLGASMVRGWLDGLCLSLSYIIRNCAHGAISTPYIPAGETADILPYQVIQLIIDQPASIPAPF